MSTKVRLFNEEKNYILFNNHIKIPVNFPKLVSDKLKLVFNYYNSVIDTSDSSAKLAASPKKSRGTISVFSDTTDIFCLPQVLQNIYHRSSHQDPFCLQFYFP
jgi:hypothetical protein